MIINQQKQQQELNEQLTMIVTKSSVKPLVPYKCMARSRFELEKNFVMIIMILCFEIRLLICESVLLLFFSDQKIKKIQQAKWLQCSHVDVSQSLMFFFLNSNHPF